MRRLALSLIVLVAASPAGASAAIVGWGENGHAELGAGYRGSPQDEVTALVQGAVQIVATGHSGYALMPDGTVESWGGNTYGQLGDGTRFQRPLPVRVRALTGVTEIAASGDHALALLANGTVATWGGAGYGQLGTGFTTHGKIEIGEPTPVLVPGLSGVVAVFAGGADDVVLLANGTLEGWGQNKSGELGGSAGERATPQPVPGVSGVRTVAIGGNPSLGAHMLAVLDDGSVVALGNGRFGQLGDGQLGLSSTPVRVSGLGGVAQVAADATHSIALTEAGSVYTWGENGQGQLGVGRRTGSCGAEKCSPVPVQVSSLKQVNAIAAGFGYSFALAGSRVLAWGYNLQRELGDGTTVERALPVPVEGLAQASAIAAGEGASLAIVPGPGAPPALELLPGSGTLTATWRAGEEGSPWLVEWRQVERPVAPWSHTSLPAGARSFTISGLRRSAAYEMLVHNTLYGTRIVTGSPL
jgi:alpha-tubulin suppressor-like RCC1 family protein